MFQGLCYFWTKPGSLFTFVLSKANMLLNVASNKRRVVSVFLRDSLQESEEGIYKNGELTCTVSPKRVKTWLCICRGYG